MDNLQNEGQILNNHIKDIIDNFDKLIYARNTGNNLYISKLLAAIFNNLHSCFSTLFKILIDATNIKDITDDNYISKISKKIPKVFSKYKFFINKTMYFSDIWDINNGICIKFENIDSCNIHIIDLIIKNFIILNEFINYLRFNLTEKKDNKTNLISESNIKTVLNYFIKKNRKTKRILTLFYVFDNPILNKNIVKEIQFRIISENIEKITDKDLKSKILYQLNDIKNNK